jgi:hypothetical protein
MPEAAERGRHKHLGINQQLIEQLVLWGEVWFQILGHGRQRDGHRRNFVIVERSHWLRQLVEHEHQQRDRWRWRCWRECEPEAVQLVY